MKIGPSKKKRALCWSIFLLVDIKPLLEININPILLIDWGWDWGHYCTVVGQRHKSLYNRTQIYYKVKKEKRFAFRDKKREKSRHMSGNPVIFLLNGNLEFSQRIGSSGLRLF